MMFISFCFYLFAKGANSVSTIWHRLVQFGTAGDGDRQARTITYVTETEQPVVARLRAIRLIV